MNCVQVDDGSLVNLEHMAELRIEEIARPQGPDKTHVVKIVYPNNQGNRDLTANTHDECQGVIDRLSAKIGNTIDWKKPNPSPPVAGAAAPSPPEQG